MCPLSMPLSVLCRHQLLLQLVNLSMVCSFCSLACSLGALQQVLTVLQRLLQVLNLCVGALQLLCLLSQLAHLLTVLLQLPFSLQAVALESDHSKIWTRSSK